MEDVTLRVFRHDPSRGGRPHYETYKVPVKRDTTVLSALLYIKEKLDPTIAIRFSCRMATCGSCGMMINGVPRLACYTLVSQLKNKTVVVAPLNNFPLVKDLVTDFSAFFEKHKMMKPYLIRVDEYTQEKSQTFYPQTDDELTRYIQFAYCIKCCLCYAACPVTATDKRFPGPQALSQLYRYYADSRDEGGVMRLKIVDDNHGVLRCHFAGSCSQVCPKGVDPALAIQLLRRALLVGRRGG
ncbi:MAG: succinate dehydrogenase/fumarate reductase iron-sulfur subunit [Nitrososphaerota archaeon]